MTPDRFPVLVGTALTAASDSVVADGVRLARALDADVHLCHAMASVPEMFDAAWLSDEVVGRLVQAEREATGRDLADQVERLGLADDDRIDLSLEPAPAHRALTETAQRLRAHLVVVGAHEGDGPLTKLFGTTASRVVDKATRPVLILRPPLAVPPRRVLMPVDLSALSADVAASGLDLLARVVDDPADLSVRLLFVLSERRARLLASHRRDTQPRTLAREQLERFVDAHGAAHPFALEAVLDHGDPAERILAASQDGDTDLVVVGTHGRSGFERLMIGSVASHVARHAPVSVLVVPPEAALRDALVREASP